VVDASHPEVAGCRWLLERGTEPFWLRCAIVARHARQRPGPAWAEAAAAGTGAAVLVAFARAVVDVMPTGGDAVGADELLARLGAVPPPFAAALRASLAGAAVG
jgi:hypothetical protein